jgi:hypothetical protein
LKVTVAAGGILHLRAREDAEVLVHGAGCGSPGGKVGDRVLEIEAAEGEPIGIEITAPAQVTVAEVNGILRGLRLPDPHGSSLPAVICID